MLTRLEVQNLALLEQAQFEPGPHFTVITGETGAGKSLLLGAFEAITGQRMDKEKLRAGAKRAWVEACFEDLSKELKEKIATRSSLDFEEENYIFSRELRENGKSYCRLNARMLPLGQFRACGEELLALHGQRDSQKIFELQEQGPLLLRYALLDPQAKACHARYEAAWIQYKKCCKKMKELSEKEAERQHLLDLLGYQLDELARVHLQEGEEERLKQRLQKLKLYLRLKTALLEAEDAFSSEEGGALPALARAQESLQSVQHLSSKLEHWVQQMISPLEILRELQYSLNRLTAQVEVEPEELESLEQRLDQIDRVKKKYGGSERAVLEYQMRAQKKQDDLLHLEQNLQRIQEDLDQAQMLLEREAQDWQKVFSKRAEELAQAINRELQDLDMKGAYFSVVFRERAWEQADVLGPNEPEFLLESNRGEGAKPLAKIASGGEAARILLAIKSILAEVDGTPVLIFDEIDAGVSGETSARIGKKMLQLSKRAQVICVTHSAYLASMADCHYKIEKKQFEDRTYTELQRLSREESRVELARLLAGDTDRDTAEQLAESLLQKAEQLQDEAFA